MRSWVPWMMVAGRAALGPLVMLGERCRWSGMALAALVVTALLSDIFDGVLARRWKTDTAALRLADSLADTAFYLCVAAAVGFAMPSVWQQCRTGVWLVVGCEILRFGFDFLKFGKPASYHSYLAKTWGLVLAPAVVVTFATQRVSAWMYATVILGVLSNLETLAMSLMLPVWRRDVKTLAAAWRLRQALLGKRKRSLRAFAGLAALLGVLVLSGVAKAQSLQHVTYVGGTALAATGLHGRVSIQSTDTLRFEGAQSVVIPYDHVISYESRVHRVVHVGLLTEGLWRLIAPWPEEKHLSLSYRDADDHKQVVVLGMSRADEALLVEVLKTRVSTSIHQPLPLLRPTVVAQEKIADKKAEP